ncbi:hypothetical protein [Microlunatus flavus]|uniref:DUF5872 domain-containing protein n=1 Tax=Microlunatus flavus TaxID=1036181 RepID=A0A1H9GB63_9ACTN|nr:hypothetical protein [Microlunatus flavus]SEQ47326.1 hypothetical protein SAMN05421756_103566 [Microlunatus flavus]
MAANHPKSWDDKYTDPDLRARLKDEVQAGDKGGKPGQWSARKAQLLKAAYEREGGGYLGEKDETQQHLSQWSKEDWQTSDGSGDARTGSPDEKGGASKRYLPKEAWDELSDAEKKATNARKAEGSAHGEQFVPNTDAAERAGRHAREHDDPGIEGFADLDAKEAVKAVGHVDDAATLDRVEAYERAHAARKTVLERVARVRDRLG